MRPLDASRSEHLARRAGAVGNRQNPVYRRSVRRVSVDREPPPKRPSRQRARCRGDRFRVGGVEMVGGCLQIGVVVAEKFAGATKEWHDVAAGDTRCKGKQFVADTIANEPIRVVGSIADRCDRYRATERLGVGPAQAEHRMTKAGSHCGEPGRSAAAQQS